MIMRSEGKDTIHPLKLDGKLAGPWIVVLGSAFGRSHVHPGQVCLSRRPGLPRRGEVRVLDNLLSEGTRVITCTRFIAEMLQHVEP